MNVESVSVEGKGCAELSLTKCYDFSLGVDDLFF